MPLLLRTFLLLSCVALLCVGCSTVKVDAPVGLKPAKVEELSLVGIWREAGEQNTEETVSLTVKDLERSLVRMTWFEEDDGKLARKEQTLHIRSTGEWQFLSLQDEDEEQNQAAYLWGRFVVVGEEVLIIWGPKVSAIKPLIEKGLLPGKVVRHKDADEDEVRLGRLEPKHLRLLASDDEGVLYAWDEPMVYLRVARNRGGSGSGE